jgi:hypothetical protein
VKRDAFAQEKRVSSGVLGNLPTVCQVGDDGLPTITRVPPEQVVKPAALRENVDALLMRVEVGLRINDPVAEDPAARDMGFRRAAVKPGPIKRAGDLRRQTQRQTIGAKRGARRRAEQRPPCPPR